MGIGDEPLFVILELLGTIIGAPFRFFFGVDGEAAVPAPDDLGFLPPFPLLVTLFGSTFAAVWSSLLVDMEGRLMALTLAERLSAIAARGLRSGKSKAMLVHDARRRAAAV